MSTVKMSDVAKLANVSATTVARVIHKNGYVSEQNRQKIEEAIETLGYVPNKIAQGLKKKETGLIGHIMPQPNFNPFFSQISGAVEKAAYQEGYHVLTLISNQNLQYEKELVGELISRMVQGIVFTSTHFPELVKKVMEINIPVVMIERPDDIYGINKVLTNDVEGSYLATRLLIRNGHQRIGFIGKIRDFFVEINRYEGFAKACNEHGIPIREEYIQFVSDYEITHGFRAAETIMAASLRPTALFVASDIIAAGVLQYLYQKNLRVPEDVSVVGYDDTLSQLMAPPLSSVGFPMEEIGETAIQMITHRVTQKNQSSKIVTINPFIVERASVRRL